MKWFYRHDLDGFFGLFIDNLVQIILIVGFSLGLLGMGDEPGFLFGTVLPGVAISVAVGNLFYAWQAVRLGRREGRENVTALPYGINTVSLFAFVFFIMLPVYLQTHDFRAAWRAGLVACLLSGVVELAGALVAPWAKRLLPRAALLSTLAGIALTFISLDFANRIFALPLVAVLPMLIIFMQYFGKVRLPLSFPAGLLAVLVGTALYWALGYGDSGALARAARTVEWHAFLPRWCGGDLLAGLREGGRYMAVIVPMGLFNLIGSLQNLESAEAAGDRYGVRSALVVNGLGSVLAALLGSPYATTIYIGHPGWKALGARAGYSALNGLVISLLVVLGLTPLIAAAIPITAGAPIVLWIGVMITVQAFEAVPVKHFPAVAMGLIPAIGALAWMVTSSTLGLAGTSFDKIPAGAWAGFAYAHQGTGFMALERGFIVSSMLWATLTVLIVERRFLGATVTCLILAACAWVGIIHTWTLGPGGALFHRFMESSGWQPQWQYAAAYLSGAVFFALLHMAARRRGA